jgi:hypothetical protein
VRRHCLATAIRAGIAGLVVPIDECAGVYASVLIEPYYTLPQQPPEFGIFDESFAAPPDRSKPVKVRFLEGYNSREVLDFDLYLTPHDVWTGVPG